MKDNRDKESALAKMLAARLKTGEGTKQTAVRLAITEAIRSGVYGPGDMLPTEQALTKVLGVSLGTVQKALNLLQAANLIERKRRQGTRVLSQEQRLERRWHFRLRHKQTGQWLSRVSEDEAFSPTKDSGPWSEFLGDLDEYLLIARSSMQDVEPSLSDPVPIRSGFFIDPKMVPGLKDLQPKDLGMLSIRDYLIEKFELDIDKAVHQVAWLAAGQEDGFSGARVDCDVLCVDAFASSSTGTPVYFQRILLPADRCTLQI